MAPQADFNVPSTPNPKLSLVNLEVTWHIHKGANGVNFNEELPQIPSGPKASPDTVQANLAAWEGLSKGGRFSFGGKPVIVEQLLFKAGSGSVTWSIVSATGAKRTAPSAPFKMGAGEVLVAKVIGVAGGDSAEAGALVRQDDTWLL